MRNRNHPITRASSEQRNSKEYADQIEEACNFWIKEYPPNRIRTWTAYYLAWAESDGWYSGQNPSYNDPHQVLQGIPHWAIKYHPESLKMLKKTGTNFKKILECVLNISLGHFPLEIVNDELLKIVLQTENNHWVAAVAVFMIGNHEQQSVEGHLIFLSVNNDRSAAEEVLNKFARTKNRFLKLEGFQSLFDITQAGYILPKQGIPANIFHKNFSEWDDSFYSNENPQRKVIYIEILHENISDHIEKIKELVSPKKISNWITVYLIFIKAQIRRDRSLQLSQAQEYALRELHPHYKISKHFNIHFLKDAYSSIKKKKIIYTISWRKSLAWLLDN